VRSLFVVLGFTAAIYVLLVAGLMIGGKRVAAKELATLVPNLLRLFKDLVNDPQVPRGAKVSLGIGAVWLASPIDLLPEFLPVIGPLDDAIVAALILRHLVRRAGVEVVSAHWRGDPRTLQRVLSLAGIRAQPR
jgi:uncharacterized membrane protein YkvA (DUF1232 family)